MVPRNIRFNSACGSPIMDFWGCISGPAKWGEEFEDTARAELLKQTGIDASCKVRSFLRARDIDDSTDDLLEDKLSVIMQATIVDSNPINSAWSGGQTTWQTLAEFERHDKRFANTAAMLTGAHHNTPHSTTDPPLQRRPLLVWLLYKYRSRRHTQ